MQASKSPRNTPCQGRCRRRARRASAARRHHTTCSRDASKVKILPARSAVADRYIAEMQLASHHSSFDCVSRNGQKTAIRPRVLARPAPRTAEHFGGVERHRFLVVWKDTVFWYHRYRPQLDPMAAKWAAALFVAGSGALSIPRVSALSLTTGGKGSDDGVVSSSTVPPRPQQISKLASSSADKPFDVLIVGGGATGSGCAVDAVSR